MQNDPLSDVLRLANVQPVVAGGFSAGGAWSLRFPVPDKLKFFALVKGGCWLLIDGEPSPVRVNQGDVFVMSSARGFVLCSDPALTPVEAIHVFSGTDTKTATLGDGQDCVQIGGHVRLDPVSGRLLGEILPPLIHIHAHDAQAEPLAWMLAQLVIERTERPLGAALASSQLIQLMFLTVLRIYLQADRSLPPGTLRAIGDRRLAPALRLMHAQPGHAWRLDDLAVAAAMSRTTFAAHFKLTAGVAPLTYLASWRMRLAESALRDEDVGVAVVAARLGYTSESAFSNAFKRHAGRSPLRFREASRVLNHAPPGVDGFA